MTTTTEDADVLAPCPFCGNEPSINEDDTYGSCEVFCYRCDAGPSVSRPKEQLAEAIAVWNTRPVPEGFVLVPKASVEQWRGYLCHNNQLLDGWHQDGTVWTDWDTKVRADMSEMQREVEDIWSAAPAREGGNG